ncbi:HNH endonuclease [Nostoc commune]|uniref:HNH endonuclease n=1 Tax=Nostoc commune TaxID=1178 RepID=UPI0018C4C47F|nr:HNH endonuclease [Nostoc commune]MBG1257989.1 HNH endonuclease [Nostoc commune BAE]
MSKTPRIRIPPEVKKYVFQRDKYQCQSCGKTTIETNLSIDHIIPLARGGQNDFDSANRWLETKTHKGLED